MVVVVIILLCFVSLSMITWVAPEPVQDSMQLCVIFDAYCDVIGWLSLSNISSYRVRLFFLLVFLFVFVTVLRQNPKSLGVGGVVNVNSCCGTKLSGHQGRGELLYVVLSLWFMRTRN
ncbi:hypothetical protein HS088_TW21G01244 [Tripterygium wilfordii]|uniref:Uncharacterized protein n=1 Tax=Tripterygium wilfordii TaxID=458696 RepID=A0A7J7C5I9_TRIWF|nr:hypothetical protein HS088_TW21G01244 [Tripterygium wilfordii]